MIDDAESYAPVVQWSTIRFFLVLSMMMAWTTMSVDWICAFPQTPLEKPMFVQTPRGFLNKCGKNEFEICTWIVVPVSTQSTYKARVTRVSV